MVTSSLLRKEFVDVFYLIVLNYYLVVTSYLLVRKEFVDVFYLIVLNYYLRKDDK